jgi:hypothetical protein
MYLSGIDPTQVDTVATHAVGEVGWNMTPAGAKGYMYVLVGAGGFTGDGFVVDIDGSTFSAVMSTTTTTAPGTGAGKAIGVARGPATLSRLSGGSARPRAVRVDRAPGRAPEVCDSSSSKNPLHKHNCSRLSFFALKTRRRCGHRNFQLRNVNP